MSRASTLRLRLAVCSAVGFLMAGGEADAQTLYPWSWTGFYVGTYIANATVSNVWKKADGNLPTPFPGRFSGGGIVSGAQAGYNHQIGNLVLGLEADAGAADIDGAARCAIGLYLCDAKIHALGTFAGRLGVAYDDFLLFGKAGGAWADEKLDMVPGPGHGVTAIWQGEQFRLGWMAGIGAEYAFTPGLSAKIEYDHLAFDRGAINLSSQGGGPASVTLAQYAHVIKLGFNYKIGAPPWSAPPGAAIGPYPNWDGIYVGLHTGGGWGTTDWNSATGALSAVSTSTFFGSGTADGNMAGGQIGINRRQGAWVVGAEADASWANLDGYARCATTDGPTGDDTASHSCHTRIDALGTIAGRLGAGVGNLLIFGKAGAAWARDAHEALRENATLFDAKPMTRWGYMLGSGLEYPFTPAWSGKIEYNYLDFGVATVSMVDQTGNRSDVRIGQTVHLIKMGLNYRLGTDPSAPGVEGWVKTPPLPWTIEAGTRYWYSNGKIQEDLYAAGEPERLNSRLIYGGMAGHAAEAFTRFDHLNGTFAKTSLGIGTLVNGRLNDEDMPPLEVPYSNTEHSIHDSSLRYGSLDVGYNLWNGADGTLGPYLGYRYFYQRARAFGCTQIASGTGCTGATATSPSVVGLTETEQWRGIAVGLNARLPLAERLTLEGDAAYLPYVDRAGVDNHWARPDINPGPETGRGWGTQVEALMSYTVTERLSLGAGGRYWFYATREGATQFPGLATFSLLKFTSERYGGFVQASYKLGPVERWHAAPAPSAPATNWTGLYAGSHVGSAVGRADWSDPFPTPPSGDRVALGGALGGGQIGLNYQTGNAVFGAELAGAWSRIEGTETCFGGLLPASSAALNCETTLDGLGTLTGRVGYAADRNLLYAKAGFGLARQHYALNANTISGGIQSASATTGGWLAGGGLEHALDPHWSVNLEYKYLDFGSQTVNFVVPAAYAAAATEPISTRVHSVTLGVNYRFDALNGLPP